MLILDYIKYNNDMRVGGGVFTFLDNPNCWKTYRVVLLHSQFKNFDTIKNSPFDTPILIKKHPKIIRDETSAKHRQHRYKSRHSRRAIQSKYRSQQNE